MGASVRHGPHHGAQKSTNTSFPGCKTAWSKSLSLSSVTYSLMSFSSEDLFYDCFVHASFGDKFGSLPIHLNQEIPSFIVNKCYRGYPDSDGSIRATSLSPAIFQFFSPGPH